ncbi:MAG: thiamine pyrophosphate-dependent dehydrogenase E1 component subunit alpha [Gemmatimonadota bacterium]
MRRYQLFDPPEYFNWKADPKLVREFGDVAQRDADRAAIIEALSDEQLLRLYEGLLRSRLVDYALKRWVRQGVISKAWLATGEESVTVGNVHALERGSDVVAPMIRNAGACHEMGMAIERMLHGCLGSSHSPNRGIDGHIGDQSLGIIAPISHVGEMVPVVTGVALAFQKRKQPRVALTWIGDGSTKTSAAHEGFNLAAVLKVPAIFVIQNNQVALGTRIDQHQCGDFREWGRMYGMPMLVADGNNVLDVYAATRIAAERARNGGGPSMMLVTTFRMGGHATHDEAEGRRTFAAELFDHWGKRDPIGLYEEWLLGRGFTREQLSAIEDAVIGEVDSATERAAAEHATVLPNPATAELSGVSAGVRQPGLASRL